MNSFQKHKMLRLKGLRFWLVYVATPIIMVIMLVSGVYVKKCLSRKDGVQKGLMYAAFHRYEDALDLFKKELVKNPEDTNIPYYMGISYLNLKEYDKAMASVETTLKTNPDFPDASLLLAVTKLAKALELRRLGKDESLVLELLLEAEEICRGLIEKKPDYKNAYFRLGQVRMAQGFVEDAITNFKDALRLDNNFIDAHIALARIYMQRGELNSAEKECDVVLKEVDPDNYEAQMLLSAIYEQRGELDKSAARLRKILEDKPEDIATHVQLGLLYLKMSKYDDAFAEAEQVHKLNPASLPPAVYFIKGSVQLHRRDYTNAIVSLREVTKRLPKLTQPHYLLALALAENGHIEEARKEFKTVIDYAPGFVPAQLGLARLLAREERHEETIELCKNILEIEPSNVDAMQILGIAYMKIQDFKNAEELFQRFIEIKPTLGEINMAHLSLASGQLSKCIRQCEQIIRVRPEEARAYDILGQAYARRGDLNKSIEQFQKAIEINPYSVATLLNLVKVYEMTGKYEDAIETIENLISTDPDNLNARIMMTNLYIKKGDIDVSTKILENLLEIDPDYVPGYALATLRLLDGKADETIDLCNKALKLVPKDATLYINLAVAYQQKGDYALSISSLKKAVELNPRIPSLDIIMTNIYIASGEFIKAREQVNSISMFSNDEKREYLGLIDLCQNNKEMGKQVTLALNKAIVARQKGVYRLAIDECKRAEKMLPENLIPKLLLASTYLSADEKEEAIGIYSDIIEHRHEFASRDLGMALLLSGRKDEAIPIYQALVTMDKESASARLTLARLLLEKGSTDEAIKIVEDVIELDPENLIAHIILGEINLANAKYEEAEREFLKVIETKVDIFEGYFNMARLKFEQAEFDECIGYCKSGLQIKSVDIRLLNILGTSYEKKGMLSEAETEFRKILDIDSNYLPAYMNLARIKLKQNQPHIAVSLYNEALKIKPDIVEARLGLGNSYALMGNHTAATKEFETIHNNIAAYLSIARSYIALGKYDKARQAALKVLNMDTGNPVARFLLAKIYMENEDISQAIDQLKTLLHDNPKFIDTYVLGVLYIDRGEYDNAISTYRKGVENFSDNESLWCNMAIAYLLRGDYEDAKEACLKALEIQPKDIKQNLCMINILMTKGEVENAKMKLQNIILNDVQKNSYQDFIESCSRNKELAIKAGHHLSRAIAYANNKWFKRALREYEEITKIVPDNTFAYEAQVDILAMTGEYDMAIEICKKIISLEPESPFAYDKLAVIYNHIGDKDEAEAQYRKLIDIDPHNPAAYMGLGMVLESKDVIEESIKAYERVIELLPSSPAAYNNLAWLYATRKNDKWDYALKLAEKAKELAPDSAAVADTYGWIYYLSGRYDKALSELKTAVKAAPWDPTVHYHLGMAYHKKGMKALAVTEMERALSINNKFPEAKEAMKLIDRISNTKGTKKEVNLVL